MPCKRNKYPAWCLQDAEVNIDGRLVYPWDKKVSEILISTDDADWLVFGRDQGVEHWFVVEKHKLRVRGNWDDELSPAISVFDLPTWEQALAWLRMVAAVSEG